MDRLARTVSLTAALLIGITAQPQFYPSANATCCLYNNSTPEGIDFVLEMNSDPDTIIGTATYQRVTGNNWHWTNLFHVRSSDDGKGYMYVPSVGEFLTGDLNAVVGDTVHDVMVVSSVDECPPAPQFNLVPMVVDSVVTLSNLGVTVTRTFVHTPCYVDANFIPANFFWQGGMGTAHGPFLVLTPGLSHLDLRCSMVDGIGQFNWVNEPGNLPGGPACCAPLTNSVEDLAGAISLRLVPDPCFNEVRLVGGSRNWRIVRVMSPDGREVMRTGFAADSILTVGHLMPGCYLLQALDDRGLVHCTRFVKE
jgi:hypothetical protein